MGTEAITNPCGVDDVAYDLHRDSMRRKMCRSVWGARFPPMASVNRVDADTPKLNTPNKPKFRKQNGVPLYVPLDNQYPVTTTFENYLFEGIKSP